MEQETRTVGEPGLAGGETRTAVDPKRAGQDTRTAAEPKPPVPIREVEFPELEPRREEGSPAGIDHLKDVKVEITVEIGRKKLRLEEVQALRRGEVVVLDSYSGEPLSIYANGVLIAEGEPVVVGNDHFAVKIVSIVPQADRGATGTPGGDQSGD